MYKIDRRGGGPGGGQKSFSRKLPGEGVQKLLTRTDPIYMCKELYLICIYSLLSPKVLKFDLCFYQNGRIHFPSCKRYSK